MTDPTDVADAANTSSRRRPWLAVIVALVVVVAAGLIWMVSTGDGDESSAPGGTVSGNTTVATTNEAPPPLHNMGEDFTAIFTSLSDFQNWAFQNPDPKWTELTTDPRCECYATTQDGLASLKSKGHRHSGPGVKVNQVEVRDRLSPDQVTLYVALQGLPDSIVDTDGAEVRTVSILPPTGFLEELVRGSDGRWRILQVTVLGPVQAGDQ